MPKNKVSDLITDQEIAFARLVLSGTMTDRAAAQAVGLNPDTAAYTKSKPCVRAYMMEHRAAVQQQLAEQETDLSRLPRPAVGRGQQEGKTTDSQPCPAVTQEEDEPGLAEPEPTPGSAADAPPPPGITFDPSESAFANRFSSSETTPSAPYAPAFVSAPDTRVPFSIKKNPFARHR